jgi:DNA invertase Pin-like site-specific DNA recombinase
MFVQMLGVFAEFERATIVERVIAGVERKTATGGLPGGYRPFRYEPDPETGLLVVKEDEAPLVLVIFDLCGNKRLGSRAVAQWLNRRGHRTRRRPALGPHGGAYGAQESGVRRRDLLPRAVPPRVSPKAR